MQLAILQKTAAKNRKQPINNEMKPSAAKIPIPTTPTSRQARFNNAEGGNSETGATMP